MKKTTKIVVFSLCVFLLISILIGVAFFVAKQDNTKGLYFRKMYGSIGIVNNVEYTMQMVLYSFEEKVDFLNDLDNISFDNKAVSITNISYKVQSTENDLTIYSVLVSLKLQKQGRHIVNYLNYNGQTENLEDESFCLGELCFIYEGTENEFIQHGCNTNIDNGEAVFTFSADNTKAFTIIDTIVDGRNIKYEYNKNVHFTPGTDLTYIINVDSSVSKYDLLLLQPIFVIEYEDAEEYNYFSPYMIVYSGVDMTYDEIKEYVK